MKLSNIKIVFISIILFFSLTNISAQELNSFDNYVSKEKNKSFTSNSLNNSTKKLQPKFKDLSILESHKISLSVSNIDYKHILTEILKDAGLNLVISTLVDEAIQDRGKITVIFTELSLKDVLDTICKILDISWKIENNTVFIDLYEQKIFNLSFLTNLQTMQYNIGGDVLGGGVATNANTITPLTGNFKVEGSIDKTISDIYSEIEQVLSSKLNINQTSITKTQQQSTQSEATSSSHGSSLLGSYILNRQTASLIVKARPSILNEIQDYVKTIVKRYNKYIFIDARILEVELYDNYRLGIDWHSLELQLSKSLLNENKLNLNLAKSTTFSQGFFTASITDRYFNANTIIEALKQYGNVKTISNPRLKAINGQTAILSIGRSISFLRELTREENISDTTITNRFEYQVDISSIFDGILLGVTPIILDDGSVNMHVVPIKSELISIGERSFGDSVSYSLPEVSLTEASTVIRTRDGEISILGGFIKERISKNTTGLPILKNIPVAGRLFRTYSEEKVLREMIIILQVSVFDSEQ